MIWKRLFYASACLTLLCLAAAVFLYLNNGTSPRDDVVFEPTGNMSHDVLQALVETDRLEAMPSDAQTPAARQAIRMAEQEFGLLTDGFPDQALLDQLIAKIEAGGEEQAAAGGWTLDRIFVLVSIIGAIVTAVIKVLTFYRETARA